MVFALGALDRSNGEKTGDGGWKPAGFTPFEAGFQKKWPRQLCSGAAS